MFKYFGSKHLLSGAYPSPSLSTIVEPFAGSAAYAVRHRRDADRVVLIEKDVRVVDLWQRLLSTTARELLDTPDPVSGSSSSDLLVALAAGRTTRDTPVTFRVSPRMAQRYRPMVSRIASVLDEVRHFEVRQGDYTDAPEIEAVWFIDPPYQSTGTGRWDRTRGGRYMHSNRLLDYQSLGEWCQQRRGQVIVCEQEGSSWLPWNGSVGARDGNHSNYQEVWWHRPSTERMVEERR